MTNGLRNRIFVALCFVTAGLIYSCKKDKIDNPYDQVNYSVSTDSMPEPDPNSITGLHKNIFSKKCANPGCHDGTFAPDFRTVQSSWSTLVYMTANKRTVDSISYFSLRVVPGNVSQSALIERLTTTTSDYMPSNSVRLSAADIDHVKNWISGGAKDAAGNIPVKPNLPPNVIGYLALNPVTYARLDSIRLNNVSYFPFIAAANTSFVLPVFVTDTADGSSATDPSLFTGHKVRFSTDENDFTSSTLMNATWMSPIPYGVWQVTVNTAAWSPGTTVYFRVYMNDGFQSSDVEFPKDASPSYYKTYFAFYVQ
jgi:hypothetical protein